MDYTDLVFELKKLGINKITLNHQEVGPGVAYIALNGSKYNATTFIKDVCDAGAAAIIFDSNTKFILNQEAKTVLFFCNDLKKNLPEIIKIFYSLDFSQLSLIGVTGTNGKTSTCYFVAKILGLLGKKAEIIGTLGFGQTDSLKKQHLTTPNIASIYEILSNQIQNEVNYCCMEVSSHALVQDRVKTLNFKYAVFTNLTADHLDYHGNMENYYQAKKKLFVEFDNLNNIINLDCLYGMRLANELLLAGKNVVGYSFKLDKKSIDPRIKLLSATNIIQHQKGISCSISFEGNLFHLETKLLGLYNLSNLLAAIALLVQENITIEQILESVKLLHPVPGRMVSISSKNKPQVIVDFAHTPDALEKVITAIKTHNNNIIIVFGCGGDRDKTKRPIMAKIAEKYAKFTIVTDDNPRSENPNSICEEIAAGFSGKQFEIINDRKQAINQALKIASNNDLILIAGKGHEEDIIYKNNKIKHSDIEFVRELLC